MLTNIIGDWMYIMASTIQRTTIIMIKHRRNDFNIVKSGLSDAYIKLSEKQINKTHEITKRVKLLAGIPSNKLSAYVTIWRADNDTKVIW